jgi:hypothetical protein
MNIQGVLTIALVGILMGFLWAQSGDLASVEKGVTGQTQQNKDQDSLEPYPLLDLFSKDCFDGCYYACIELIKGNPAALKPDFWAEHT